jgi:predicted transglutaminase-like cysteine proteinase
MINTARAKVFVDVDAPQLVRRIAPYVLAATLALAMLASASGAALAKSRKPHPIDLTGFGPVPRIELPTLHELVRPTVVAPARVFTINKVLAKLDGAGSGRTRLAARTDASTLSDAEGLDPRPQSSEPFGLFTFQAPEGVLWQKWRGVSADIVEDLDAIARCRASADACSPAATRFIAVIDEVRKYEGRARLEAVDRVVNAAIRYTTDMQQHGVPDLWSSPLATFATLRGDCEDYAIAKYVALREAGIAADDLRIVLAHDNALGEDHAILAARQDGRWLILDNRRTGVLADSEVKHLAPLFFIDAQGVKLLAVPYVQRTPDRGEAAIAPAADSAGTSGAWTATRPLFL